MSENLSEELAAAREDANIWARRCKSHMQSEEVLRRALEIARPWISEPLVQRLIDDALTTNTTQRAL